MFVRRLVSGVRSSCEASATSWRCARLDSSSAASIVLKLAASRVSSSWPLVSIRSERSPVSVTRSVASVRRRTGASAAFETARPRAAAIRTPPAVIRNRKSVIRDSVWFTSERLRATCSAYPFRNGTVSTRTSVSETVASSK